MLILIELNSDLTINELNDFYEENKWCIKNVIQSKEKYTLNNHMKYI